MSRTQYGSNSHPDKNQRKRIKRSREDDIDQEEKVKKRKSTSCKFFLNGYCRDGYNCQYKHDLSELPTCPCGGGQSCLIDRRRLGDWVFEDDILKKANLPIRKSCLECLGEERNAAIAKAFGK